MFLVCSLNLLVSIIKCYTLLFFLGLDSIGKSGSAVRQSLALCGCTDGISPLLAALLDVGVDVKVGKETDEGEGVANQSVVHPLGEVAINVERVDSMDYCETELKLLVRVRGRWKQTERERGRER